VHDSGSSARLAAAADAERCRIERALHDGVQQDLVALSVRVQLARQLAATDITDALQLLEEIVGDVHDALDRVRALSEQIYPSLLTSQGLPAALRALGFGVRTDAEPVGRYPPELEAAVYFCCRELLDEHRDHRATVSLWSQADVLHFEIAGVGHSRDLTHMRDRVEALRGRVAIEAEPDDGVRIAGAIPLYEPVSAR
jgi:signal transduction histidine kinase